MTLAWALEAFCRASITELERQVPDSGQLPQRSVLRFRSHGPHAFEAHTVAAPDWTHLVHFCEQQLRQLPSYSAALSALRADVSVASHLGKLVGNGLSARRVKASECLSELLIQVLRRTGALQFRRRNFFLVYRDMEAFFHRSTVSLRSLSPLYGAYLDHTRLQLDSSLAIVRLTEDDQEFFGEHLGGGHMLPSMLPLAHEQCALEYVWTIPKIVHGAHAGQTYASQLSAPEAVFHEALSALRLFKPGAILCTHYRTRPAGWDWQGFSYALSLGSQGAGLGEGYLLTAGELPALRACWNQLRGKSTQRYGRLWSAIRRFDYGYERIRVEDRLVDFVIALEAILLDDSELGDLSYRLALRGAALLATKPQERADAFHRLKKAYSLRSKIVHGSIPEGGLQRALRGEDASAFIRSVEADVRRVILEMLRLSRGKSEREVSGLLDARAIGYKRVT